MSAKPNLFPLKALVISLGLVLIGGTICLFGAIASKAGKEVGAHACANETTAELHLTGKNDVQSIVAQGDTVQISVVEQGKIQVLTLDRCSGKLLHTFNIKP